MNRRILILVAFLLPVAGCGGYRPARFAERPPVWDVGDDKPIALPKKRVVHEPIWFADVYLRRPLMDALEAERIPDAGDVNALDEVPRSSWFDPRELPSAIFKRPGSPGPPKPPLVVLAERATAGGTAFRVLDARGIAYELGVDPADRPGMKTAAAAIASRLVWALGYRCPEVHVTDLRLDDFVFDERAQRRDGSRIDVEAALRSGPPPSATGRFRVSAALWPVGIEVGPAPIASTREDDPNDLVPHRDRRSLRALHVLGSWLNFRRIGPHTIADVYVGPPDEGHLQHFIVGLDAALGAADVVREGDPEPAIPTLSPLESLFTLGLARSPRPAVTQTDWPAIGEFSPDVDPSTFAPPDPYEPIERILPADGYWAAKRIARLPRRLIAQAVRAAKIENPAAAAYLVETLEARKKVIVAHWYEKVSPLEVEGIRGGDLLIGDRAIADGIARAETSAYSIEFFDEEGSRVAKTQKWQASGRRFRLPISPSARSIDYLVVRIVAKREGRSSPRAFEVHLVQRDGKAKVVGVRH